MPQKQKGVIDRLPIICAAGRDPTTYESVKDLLHVYTKDDIAEKLVIDKEKHRKKVPRIPATPVILDTNQLRDILGPDLNKSRFLEFKDRFYENLYCKKVPLGKPTPANSKPDHITNESVTFGKVYARSESVYDIALPKKNPDEVMREYIKWHDKFRLSHGDYYPSEQIRRGYNDKFDADRTYGVRHNADTSGAKVRGIMENYKGAYEMNIIGITQKNFIKHHHPTVGYPLKRHENDFDPKKTFGHVATTDEFHVKELLDHTVPPEEIKKYANVTTYRAFATDLYNSPVDCRGPAGKMDSKYPQKRECKIFGENLGEETTAKQLISPSIPSHFGLSHRDFFVPRSKDQIRKIFSNAGFDLKDEEYFNKIWAVALTEWTSVGDLVSIEAFKYALHKIENKLK